LGQACSPGISLALDGDHGGAATPPYPNLVGRTCLPRRSHAKAGWSADYLPQTSAAMFAASARSFALEMLFSLLLAPLLFYSHTTFVLGRWVRRHCPQARGRQPFSK